MSHEHWLHMLATIQVIAITIIVVIDVGVEFGFNFLIKLKWTLFWYGCRYLAIGCAIALAIDTLF